MDEFEDFEVTPSIVEHLLICAELAERETDPHLAFHVRSNLPMDSPLCASCAGEPGAAWPVV